MSILEYNFLNNLNNYFLYEIFPKTGRHHQIRVQLSTMGSPIKGDLKYGAKRSNPNGGINLHAKKIDFNHPVTKESVSIEANCPKEKIWNSIN